MKRRDFLNSMALGASLVVPVSRSAWAATTDNPTGKKLVVVMLRGAVDGLNVVAPFGDANYYACARPSGLRRPACDGGVLDLDGYFGMHPALATLQPLWQQKKLAFVHACGSPDPTRSTSTPRTTWKRHAGSQEYAGRMDEPRARGDAGQPRRPRR